MKRNLGARFSISSERRHELTAGWQTASAPPGRVPTPDALAGAALDWLPAQVPGTVASALRAAGHDVFREPRALDASDHWFRTRFPAPAHDAARVELRCDGLATHADVWLNGQALTESRNMFVPASCDVTDHLRADNELCIRFRALDAVLAEKRPRPRWRTRLVDHQQLRWQRTSLLGRMPGWTPPVHAVGPYRPLWLVVRSGVDVVEADVRAEVIDLDARSARVSVQLVLGAGCAAVRGAELCVGETRVPLACQAASPDGAGCVVQGELKLSNVALWWPHTHGAQPLYPVSVRLQVGAAQETVELGRVGFRSIALDTEAGRFALRINGCEIFARGAGWMTPDAVALPGTAEAYEPDLLLARDAGMNMLRISGTTSYESDAFFRRCDELGILVWQDFMFANMDYPIDDAEFAASVDAEARTLLQLTQSHACLALLCGGSEVEQQIAMLGLPREAWHGRLFYAVLPALVAELRPDVPYWPSTPSGGALPFEARSGACHYYGVGAYLRPVEDARRAEVKFAAECLAFANVPDEASFRHVLRDGEMPVHHPVWKARVARDVGATWDFEDVREHYLRAVFGVDPLELRYTDLERYLALSRVVTGELMASTLSEWRRARSTCRGALVWFFRDLWPGAGLGLIDATGRAKAAYYYVKRALAPQAAFFSDEGLNGLALHVINEREAPLAATLQVVLHRDAHGSVIAAHELAVDLPARGQSELQVSALLSSFIDTTYAYRFGPPSHDLVVARLVARDGGDVLSDAFYFPLGLPRERDRDVGLRCDVRHAPDGTRYLELRSERFAQSVFVDVPGYAPDDNYFHLAPAAPRRIRLARRAGAVEGAGRISALNTRHVLKVPS